MTERITNHEEQGAARLVTQFKRTTIMKAFLQSHFGEAQALEGVLWEIYDAREIDKATGAQLDVIGKLVKQPREGRDDAAYRLALKARRAVHLSSGTPDQLMRLVTLMLPAVTVSYSEAYPCSFRLDAHGATAPTEAEIVAGFLAEARSAGVRGSLVYSEHADSETFFWASGDDEEASTDQGWADDSKTTGGYMVDVIGA